MATSTLSMLNPHPRDQLITFINRGHKYIIATDKKSTYTSVTTWVKSHFPKFDADKVIENIFKSKNWGPDNKYWGMTAEQIKASWNDNGKSVAAAGTELHERIETFYNTIAEAQATAKEEENAVEWNYFLEFVAHHKHLKPYRTEWMIFDETLKIAGSIDMVFENEDGTLSIYDWKRSKDIVKTTNWNDYASNPLIASMPNTNFWHYALQLNVYKAILERQYGKTITHLCLVKLHPDNESGTYELLEVPFLDDDIQRLFAERMATTI